MIAFKRAATRAAPTEKSADGVLRWRDVFGEDRDTEEIPGPLSALTVSAYYRVLDLRSDSIGRLPVKVKDLEARAEVRGHPLGPLLWERPNEAMTPYTYKKLVEYRRLALGNSYVWIYRDRWGRPVELLPLPAGSCAPYVEPGTGKVWYIAADPKTGESYRLDPMDVLHYKGFSVSGLEGMGLLEFACRSLAVARNRDQYEADLYRNGGRPSGVLATETDISGKAVTLEDGTKLSYKDVIRKNWEKIHSGPGNAFRVAVLDNGLKYTPIAMTASDAQFSEAKALTVADLARFGGVPLYLLYSGKESYQSNAANGVEYVKYTLQPTVTQYEEEDSHKLLTLSELRRGLWLQRNMRAEFRGDPASQMAWYRGMVEIGAYSVNEIRELEDEPDVPGGDGRRASLNYVPLEDWAELSRMRAGGAGAPRATEPEE